ncbi:MAG TPA: hypothetical protein PLC15_01480 [Candidatus Obscuribacter sp.]|nr:hypothetical protein [Candidatus Obscuribacter sp.]HMY53910.1 hypothetical protein [Candidatus Obscuribacter sp.]HNB14016.1 hypothetical protein [Candidatus Obscuribacter sp.]HND65951.1 hypothetical protein [Candidatus Obscuribacter sp.]HNG17846.1 hypothetical protein [Candidatus Obscuribacter sp.]
MISLRNQIPVFMVALGLLLLSGANFLYWSMHPLSISADQSVYVQSGLLLLQGKVPYLDFFDFNPPLIVYLNVIPVLVARALALPLPMGLNMTVMTLNVISTLFSAFILYRYAAQCRPAVRLVEMLPVLAMYAAFTQALVTDFGQREHLFTIAFMPFFVLRGLRHAGASPSRLISCLSGLLAGLLMSLKPQFFLIWFFSELGFLCQGVQSFRFPSTVKPAIAPELLALLLPAFVYALSFFFLPRQALKVFFDVALPIYLFGNNWGARSFMPMLVGGDLFAWPFYQFLAGALIYTVLRRESIWLSPLLMICLASLFNYLSGGQAWTYRLLPFSLYSKLLLALEVSVLLRFLYDRFKEGFRQTGALASAVFLLCSGYLSSRFIAESVEELVGAEGEAFDLKVIGYSGTNIRSELDPTFFCMVENSHLGDKVLYIGSGIRPGYPAQLQCGRRPGSRYLYGYPLTMLDQARENRPDLTARFKALEARVVAELGEDISKNKPLLVFVQRCPTGLLLAPYHFISRYLQNYSLIGEVDGAGVYKLTGSKVDLKKYSVGEREAMVLQVICGQKTTSEVATEKGLPVRLVEDWVERARSGMRSNLDDRTLDERGLLKLKIEELNSEIWQLNRQVDKLRNGGR